MLAREQRLRRSEDIMRVMRHGRRIKMPHALLYVAAAPNTEGVRVACIVGKRVHRSAVRRHSIQRRLRESVRTHLPRASSPVDLVVVAQPSIVEVRDFEQLAAEVAHGLIQSKFFTEQ